MDCSPGYLNANRRQLKVVIAVSCFAENAMGLFYFYYNNQHVMQYSYFDDITSKKNCRNIWRKPNVIQATIRDALSFRLE